MCVSIYHRLRLLDRRVRVPKVGNVHALDPSLLPNQPPPPVSIGSTPFGIARLARALVYFGPCLSRRQSCFGWGRLK